MYVSAHLIKRVSPMCQYSCSSKRLDLTSVCVCLTINIIPYYTRSEADLVCLVCMYIMNVMVLVVVGGTQ